MKYSLRLALNLLTLVFLTPARANQAGFDFFKSLDGSWSISANGEVLPFEMSYGRGSRDSIVLENFGKELSVFYVNGTEVWMTHFCNKGNQPRLKLVSHGSKKFEFELIDISNLQSPDEPHVKQIIYSPIAANKFKLELFWNIKGQTKIETYVLDRLSAL